MTTSGFAPFADKMAGVSLPRVIVQTFESHYRAICDGATGVIREDQIRAATNVTVASSLSGYGAAGERALARAVMIKLNGGLGTSMGMDRAKSLLKVKGDYTFLDIIARQAIGLRERFGCALPLLLMSSYHTRADCLAALAKYPSLPVEGLAMDFLQHKVPRISQDDLQPIVWPDDPSLEWCPPGHGDVYTALQSSGVLDQLLGAGFEYAFISNGDNLGAVMDTRILGWMAEQRIPFVLEVAKRTDNDKKGGHLAETPAGGLLLRESAQCADDERAEFQNITRHRYFNTNNLWIDLPALAAKLEEHDGVLPLPLIVNRKQLIATDAESPWVYQTETAMGAAVSVFEDARALLVSRERFAPVKTTNDLLKLWSDLFELSSDFQMRPTSERSAEVVVALGEHYQDFENFQQRFPKGAPSLVNAERLSVQGDIHFGAGVVVKGAVDLHPAQGGPVFIPDGTVLDSHTVLTEVAQ